MKTNNVLTRPMGDFSVNQRTKDGFFNATDLLRQWNLNTQNFGGLKKKDLDDYLNNKSTQEFVSTIIQKETLSGKNGVITSSKGRYNGGTWMHPMLFIDFAMWLNPSFKYEVIRFVSDELILLRDQAGENYKKLSAAVATIINKDKMQDVMQRLSKSMNIIVFGTHEHEIRNKRGVVGSMRELAQLENTLAEFINAGFIKTEQGIRTQLNRIFDEKYPDYKLEH
jgi:hypothetical protein